MMRRLIAVGLVAAGVLAAAAPAEAGLLPVRVSVIPEGESFRWTYAIVLPTDSMLRPGDYFTIYDFGGYMAGTNAQPADWAFSSSDTGPTPPRVLPDDSSALPNLTWTYTGPVLSAGQTGLGNFWNLSLYQDSTDSFFTASTHRTSDGRPDTNITSTTVPVPVGPSPGVPEPATLALAALGLPLVGLARRMRR